MVIHLNTYFYKSSSILFQIGILIKKYPVFISFEIVNQHLTKNRYQVDTNLANKINQNPQFCAITI